MAVNVTLVQILRLTPNAQPGYQDAFRNGQPVLDEYQISATPLRVAHFMAQILHESTGLTVQFENLNYSPERLSQVFPSRFRPNGPLDPNRGNELAILAKAATEREAAKDKAEVDSKKTKNPL